MSDDQAKPTQRARGGETRARGRRPPRARETYGALLGLILVDYVMASGFTGIEWGRVVTTALLGLTLVLALRISHARRLWRLMAWWVVGVNTLLAIGIEALNSNPAYSTSATVFAGVLLFVTPVTIALDISTESSVSLHTISGAICIYLLSGFSFAFLFAATTLVSGVPFFEGQATATPNDFLFFSAMTITTVGYGNLIPATTLGRSLAMVEMFSGQIYLVVIVARLVALWGPPRPKATSSGVDNTESTNDEGSTPA